MILHLCRLAFVVCGPLCLIIFGLGFLLLGFFVIGPMEFKYEKYIPYLNKNFKSHFKISLPLLLPLYTMTLGTSHKWTVLSARVSEREDEVEPMKANHNRSESKRVEQKCSRNRGPTSVSIKRKINLVVLSTEILEVVCFIAKLTNTYTMKRTTESISLSLSFPFSPSLMCAHACTHM